MATTVAALVPDTPRIVPVLPATARAIPVMDVHLPILDIVLLPPLFLRVRAIARIPREAVRGRVGVSRLLCPPTEGTVRTQPRVRDPARMKLAVTNAPRPLTLAPRKELGRMRFPDPWEGVRRVRGETKVWRLRGAGEVASDANSCRTRVGSSGNVLVGAM